MLKLYPTIIAHQELKENLQENIPSFLSEHHIQRLWHEQRLLKGLKTRDGRDIEVLSPGIWNKQAGPDFLKAHLRIGEHYYRGDIEIHLEEGGWIRHGHHEDPLYNEVLLHLCYKSPARHRPANKENGQQAYTCYLENSLAWPIERAVALIDLDLSSHDFFFERGMCAEHLFQVLPKGQLREFFQSAAYWRLEKKLNHLKLTSPALSLQMACGVAMALGYRHNSTQFLELFFYLMDLRDLPQQELLAVALGCCGFLEEGRNKEWENSTYYRYLRELWWGKKGDTTHQTILKLDRIRPLHHPVRRLAYLSHLLQDPFLEKMGPQVLDNWRQGIGQPQVNLKKMQGELVDVLPTYQDEYWNTHLLFGERAKKKFPLSFGKELKLHVLLNTFLPLIYGEIKAKGGEGDWKVFQSLYSSLTLPHSSKSRYLHQRFLGDKQEIGFFEGAQMVQGAYQIHHDFCTHYEASCQGCPLVERFYGCHP